MALREQVIESLRDHKRELRRLGVEGISLVGSVARAEESADSDVDLLVTIAPDAELSLLGMVRLERHLEALVGREVDLIERAMVRETFGNALVADEQRVF